MGATITRFDHDGTERRPVYGGHKILSGYYIETVQNGIKNAYKVETEIRGLETGEPYLNVINVTAYDNNEETLTDEAITGLFDEYINN